LLKTAEKKRLSMMIGILLCVMVQGATALAEGTLGPKVVIENPNHDFQEVLEGTVVTHAFKVRNLGDQVLDIKEVRPG